MWIADGWKDYEVIDTSCGEKLERWGDYLLVRPDPQVIWDTPKVNKGWKHMNGHYHRSKKGGGEWEFFGVHGDVVGAVGLELPQIGVHAVHDLVVILLRDGGIIHVPQGQLLRQYLEEGGVLIGHDGLVDAALGKGPGGDPVSYTHLPGP